ncbi:hypothetical protein ACP4OV_005395 [Aristida adscensionis]
MKERGARKVLSVRALLDGLLPPSPSSSSSSSSSCRTTKGRGRPPPPPPEGWLAVHVGAARERFVVRTECVNHRLFRALLEEAEEARGPYDGGYTPPDGPLQLPCDAAAFRRVLEAIDREVDEERAAHVGCGGGGAGGVRAHSAAAHRAMAHGRQLASN